MVKGSDPETETKQEPAPSTSAVEESGAGAATPMMAEGGDQAKKSAKSGVQIHDPPVTETRGYTIVKVEEKHGPLYLAIPAMPLPLAVLFCLFNIVLPGTGTLFSAFTVFCCGPTRIDKPCRAFGLNLASAFLQMITFLVIVGWIWSIRWGMTFVQLSLSSTKDAKKLDATPYYVRRQSSVDYQKQTSNMA